MCYSPFHPYFNFLTSRYFTFSKHWRCTYYSDRQRKTDRQRDRKKNEKGSVSVSECQCVRMSVCPSVSVSQRMQMDSPQAAYLLSWYKVHYSVTSWGRVHYKKLIFLQPVENLPTAYWNRNVLYYVHKRPPLDHKPNEGSPYFHSPFFIIHFNIILVYSSK